VAQTAHWEGLLRTIQAFDRGRNDRQEADEDLHNFYAASPEMVSLFVEVISRALELRPTAQWDCALTYGFLPNIPSNGWAQPSSDLTAIEGRFRGQSQSEADCFFLAWRLLFDAWCYLFEYRHESLPAKLVEFAKDSNHPAIRVSGAIRSLALGETDDPGSLSDLGEDPECGDVLRESGWVEDRARSGSVETRGLSVRGPRRRSRAKPALQ
jgi:hypothetical protein